MLNQHHQCRTTIMQLNETIKELNKKNSELIDRLMSRDFTDYQSAKQPAPEKDNTEIIKPQDDPYVDLEDVPTVASDTDLGVALKRANTPNS